MADPTDISKDTPRVDRRIERTRQALLGALYELINEKDFDEISVEDITQRANLGRATFYLHFKDKEELLLAHFKELTNDRVKVLSQIPISTWQPGKSFRDPSFDNKPLRPLLIFFQSAREKAKLYRLILRDESSPRITKQIRAMITEGIDEILKAQAQNELPAITLPFPTNLIAAYFSGALLSTLAWWLEEEDPMPPEEITRIFSRLFFPGLRKALGLAMPPGTPIPSDTGFRETPERPDDPAPDANNQ